MHVVILIKLVVFELKAELTPGRLRGVFWINNVNDGQHLVLQALKESRILQIESITRITDHGLCRELLVNLPIEVFVLCAQWKEKKEKKDQLLFTYEAKKKKTNLRRPWL